MFWEQVAGMGIPMVCKYWEGTTHVDCGGNVKFLYRDSVEEIKSTTGVNPSASNYNDSTIITALETWGIPMAFMSLYPLIHKFKKYKSYIGSILVVVITLFLNPSEGFSLYAGAIIMLPTLEYMDSQEKELI